MPPVDSCNENIDPLKLVRSGTNQDQRLIPALDPAHAPVNERSVAHGMLFAKAYADYLKYYDTMNVHDGNWAPFFAGDPSVLLATCAVQDTEHYKAVVQAAFDYLNDLTQASNATAIRENLSWLFAYVATLARQIDTIRDGLPADIGLKASLQNLIDVRLAPAFARMMAYYKADVALPAAQRIILDPLPAADADHTIALLGATPVAFATVFDEGLSSYWITDGSADWATYRTAIVADASVYGDPLGSEFERANHVSTHNLFTGIFDQFLKALARIVADAKDALQTTLTSYDKHEPHYALFLSFLQLLEHARESGNTLTARHLDFYYRDILQLAEHPARPSHAHVLLEPAKNVIQHEVEAGVRFRAGKDANGKELFFAGDRTLVVNQAVIGSMKKIYRHEGELFAAPLANSDDGVKSELKSADKSWHPFFNKTFTDGALSSIDMPPASISFAVVSHYLRLAEGQRTITVTFDIDGFGGTLGADYASVIDCSLTGEKGWFEGSPVSFIATSATTLELVVAVTGDQPAVVDADAKVHAFDIGSVSPVLMVTLRHTLPYPYGLFENVRIGAVTVQVDVDRVRALALSNDFGPIDATKPFLPFGAQPEAGSACIVGSPEIFCKRDLVACDLHIVWKNIPAIRSVAYRPSEQYYPQAQYDWYTKWVPGVRVQALVQGAWGVAGNQTLFDADNLVTLDILPPVNTFNPLDSPGFLIDPTYGVATRTGFMKLSLPWGLGHAAFRDALADYVLAIANGDTATKPVPPYTPEVESMYVSYTAAQTFRCDTGDADAFTGRTGRVYHRTDFGFAEQHSYLKSGSPDHDVYLFPQFRHVDGDQPSTHEAEFYIGLDGLVPPQTVAMLFQIVEGTANPRATKPRPHVHWSYLSNDEWLPLHDNDVEDGTNDLLTTGIVTIDVPREATSDNTALPAGKHWLRLAVDDNSDAVCKLVLVATQALEVTLTDENTDDVSVTTLPSSTITKLEKPDAAIKKVVQPSPTFGGAPAEASNAFYTRISERLRHKDRAITIWDIEHLVLQAFPGIHDVKCLNHTQFEPTEDATGIYRELAPGHVTVITIPDQRGLDVANPLQPFTSLGVIDDVKAYLEERMTCHAALHVCNPQFEEVRVSFKVRLHDGYDETFYVNKLKEAITRFLSPWAYSSAVHPTFGGRIYQSVLVNFVEEQEYVDYVTDFHVFHDIGGVQGTVSKQYVEGSRAVSILVSVPASKHQITVIDPVEEESLHEQCECEE